MPICYSQVASQAVYSLHKTSTREVCFSQNKNRKSTNDPYRSNLYLFFNPHVFGNFRHSTFHVSNRQHIKKAALRDFGAVSAEVLCEVSI